MDRRLQRSGVGREFEPVGVVGMAIDLRTWRPGGATTRASRSRRYAPTPRPQRGLILRHPYWSKIDDPNNPPLYYAEPIVKWADSVAKAEPFAAREEYIDPVFSGSAETPGFSDYNGPWLASAHRVRAGPEQVDTGWVIVVQERRDEVMRPVRDLQWRLSYGALGATVFILTLLTVLTLGMMSVLDGAPKSRVTRFLRRWAGLPTGTSSHGTSTTTTTSADGSVGAKTLRDNATPAEESGIGDREPRKPDSDS